MTQGQMTDVFDSVAIFASPGYDVGSEGSPLRIAAHSVTPSFFHVLRSSPMLGRTFTEDDAVFRRDRFAILSYGLWKDMFARDPAIVGKDIRLSGMPYQVVGVMPESFAVPGLEGRRDPDRRPVWNRGGGAVALTHRRRQAKAPASRLHWPTCRRPPAPRCSW